MKRKHDGKHILGSQFIDWWLKNLGYGQLNRDAIQRGMSVSSFKGERRDDRFWHGLVINQMAYHWQSLNIFGTRNNSYSIGGTNLEAEMIEGINKRKINFKPEKPDRFPVVCTYAKKRKL
jgi:hypothetical protein